MPTMPIGRIILFVAVHLAIGLLASRPVARLIGIGSGPFRMPYLVLITTLWPVVLVGMIVNAPGYLVAWIIQVPAERDIDARPAVQVPGPIGPESSGPESAPDQDLAER